MGSLHRQWCDQIPLPTIARYVVQFEQGWETGGFAPEALDGLDQTHAANIMALWSGTDPAQAPNLLLSDMVEPALQADSPGQLASVAQASGSIEVAEHVIEERQIEWSEDPTMLARAASNLADTSLTEWVSDRIWRDLWQHVQQCAAEKLCQADVAAGVVEVAKHQSGQSIELNLPGWRACSRP